MLDENSVFLRILEYFGNNSPFRQHFTKWKRLVACKYFNLIVILEIIIDTCL